MPYSEKTLLRLQIAHEIFVSIRCTQIIMFGNGVFTVVMAGRDWRDGGL